MKKVKESCLTTIPLWVLLLAIFIVSFSSAFVFEYVTIPGNNTQVIITSIFYPVIIPVACFVICMIHPKSKWYVPFICNPVALLGTIFHPLAWTTLSEYLFWVISLVISVLGAIIGAKIGQRKINHVE